MPNPVLQNIEPQKKQSPEKRTFALLFLVLAIILMILPFFVTINDILTRIVMKVEVYRVIQEKIVPMEVSMVSVVTSLFGLKSGLMGSYLALQKGGETFLVEIAWNCVGWQSFIILIFSFLTGLFGSYTRWSKAQVVIAGLCGTFLMNILRITIVALFAYFFGQFPAIIFHDYGSIIMTIAWLIFFWWFSFAYILEPVKGAKKKEGFFKQPKLLKEVRKNR
ncbi:MAG: exosortase/archaeosortase family protein [Patescibacteria group bacterium]